MGIFSKIWDVATDIGHAVTGIPTADDKRNQAKMVRDQVEAYKKQTELTRSELARTQAEKATERRRVQEKQIRALRGSYRSPNIIDSAQIGVSPKLGA